MIPQIIYLSMTFIGLLLAANQHGKEKVGSDNFWNSFIAVAITLPILYWGGFFNVFFI